MARTLLTQQISNLKVEGFENVERFINVMKIDIDGRAERIFLDYSISYILDGKNVSSLFQKQSSYQWYIYNRDMILVRDENFQPILKEEYINMVAPEIEGVVDEEWVKPEPTEDDYMKAPAFTMVMDTFDELNAIPYQVLRAYILENDADGKWDINI